MTKICPYCKMKIEVVFTVEDGLVLCKLVKDGE